MTLVESESDATSDTPAGGPDVVSHPMSTATSYKQWETTSGPPAGMSDVASQTRS